MSTQYKKATFLLSARRGQNNCRQIRVLRWRLWGAPMHGKIQRAELYHTNNKLARVSKTPGRTQQINVFVLDEDRRFMDLPVYGFANVHWRAKRKWEKTINLYFESAPH